MGVGLGFAIAAAVLVKYKDEKLDPPAGRVVCIQGDSAFGFSGMELETVFRYITSHYRLHVAVYVVMHIATRGDKICRFRSIWVRITIFYLIYFSNYMLLACL